MTAARAGGRAAIVGAGIAGLSVAWFLQEEGFQVTVHDARGVAGGASAGNAGWICPAMVAPLPEPSVLRYGMASVLRPASPVRIPLAAVPATWRFLAAFAAHCTHRRWLAGVTSYAPLNALALPSYDALAQAGVAATMQNSAMVAAFDTPGQAAALRHELDAVAAAGQQFPVDELTAGELHREQPLLAPRATYGLRINGQRFLQPLEFMQALAASVTRRGGQLTTRARVTQVTSRAGDGVRLHAATTSTDYDICVLASGAWMNELARPAGIRTPLLAGRGYSFAVQTPRPLTRPLYLPRLRVACTPAPGGIRVAGTMEFRTADDPPDQRQINAIIRSARKYLPSIDWSTRTGAWVGPRPVTADGLPIIGRTAMPGVFAAGGHGMWGMTLGPATGRLLARFIATGRRPDALAPFDPCR
jgi:D-amino-acid dehydrogenase